MDDVLRRVRILGLLQGVELNEQLELADLYRPDQTPPPTDPMFDPLSDPLDEPLPGEA